MEADAVTSDKTRGLQWGSTMLYLAAIAVLYVNSSPFGYVEDWQFVLQLVLLPLVVAAVILRVRFPYALPLVGLLGIVSGTFAVFVVGAMSLCIRRRGVGVWVTVTAGAVLAAGVIAYRDRLAGADTVSIILAVPLTMVMIGLAPALVGRYVRVRREFAVAATERVVRAEVEQTLTAQRAVHDERERIAQEMHDSLGHVLALVTMQAGALEVNAKDPSVAEAAGHIRESARAGLVELRSVVHALGADARRDPAPGWETIPRLLDASRTAGAEVRLHDELPADRSTLSSSTGRALYQALQEALTNAHRHAPGAPVEIILSGAPGAGVTARVSNPLTPGGERGAGTGLERLRSRVEALGGKIEARIERGAFTLQVWLPWEVSA